MVRFQRFRLDKLHYNQVVFFLYIYVYIKDLCGFVFDNEATLYVQAVLRQLF